MKVRMDIAPGINVEFDSVGIVKTIEFIAAIQDVALEPCGKCGNPDAVFRSMPSKTGSTPFISLKCPKCTAELALFVSSKDGRVFKGRKSKDGAAKPDNGWSIWQPQQPAHQENTAYSQPVDEFASTPAPTSGGEQIPF